VNPVKLKYKLENFEFLFLGLLGTIQQTKKKTKKEKRKRKEYLR